MTNTDHPVHRESTDVNIGGVVAFAIVLVVLGILTEGAVFALYKFMGREAARPAVREYPLASEALRRLPPEPRLQTDPREDLANMRRAEDQVLSSYGWVDRNAGVVRIPIDQAMRLTVERGLPSR